MCSWGGAKLGSTIWRGFADESHFVGRSAARLLARIIESGRPLLSALESNGGLLATLDLYLPPFLTEEENYEVLAHVGAEHKRRVVELLSFIVQGEGGRGWLSTNGLVGRAAMLLFDGDRLVRGHVLDLLHALACSNHLHLLAPPPSNYCSSPTLLFQQSTVMPISASRT